MKVVGSHVFQSWSWVSVMEVEGGKEGGVGSGMPALARRRLMNPVVEVMVVVMRCRSSFEVMSPWIGMSFP